MHNDNNKWNIPLMKQAHWVAFVVDRIRSKKSDEESLRGDNNLKYVNGVAHM